MRYASSTGTRRSSSSSTRAALSIDECVCSVQTTTRRSGIAARAAASAVSVAIDAVSSMWPCHSAGQAEQLPEPRRRPLLELGERGPVRQRIPTWFSAIVSNSARIAGSEAVFGKYARKRGCCQCVTAGRISRSRSSSSAENGSPVLRRRLGQPLEQPPRLDLREHRKLADALEVRRRPLERGRAVAPQVDGRRFLIRSICFHVRVFTTSAFVSHARRAWPIPNST